MPQVTVVPATTPRPVWGRLPGRSRECRPPLHCHPEPWAWGLGQCVPWDGVCDSPPMQRSAWIHTPDPSRPGWRGQGKLLIQNQIYPKFTSRTSDDLFPFLRPIPLPLSFSFCHLFPSLPTPFLFFLLLPPLSSLCPGPDPHFQPPSTPNTFKELLPSQNALSFDLTFPEKEGGEGGVELVV